MEDTSALIRACLQRCKSNRVLFKVKHAVHVLHEAVHIVISATVSKPVSTRNIIHRTYLSPKSQTLSPRPRSIPDSAPTQSEDPISVLPKLKLRWQMSIPLHIPIMKERAYLSREISQSFPPNEKATVGKESQGNWYSPMVSSNTFDPGIRS